MFSAGYSYAHTRAGIQNRRICLAVQFDSYARAQNRGNSSVTATQNRTEYENRNRTSYLLYLLHSPKTRAWKYAGFWAFRGAGTVPILMPVGTGSWRHNRVAGVGIEPTPGGYGPPELPLLYPATSSLPNAHPDARLDEAAFLMDGFALRDIELSKDTLVLRNGAAGKRF